MIYNFPRRPWETHYNGWSWQERCAVTPIQNAAIRSGRLVRPRTCCICGDDRHDRPQGRDYRFLHLEDYRQPFAIYPLCKADHASVHARFRDPERWQRVLRRYGRPGSWIMALSLDPTSQWRHFDEIYPRGLPQPDLPVTNARQTILPLE